MTAIADALAEAHLLDTTDVVLYADDEACASPRGAAWKALLRSAADANARRIRVAWTCSEAPATQPVDVAILLARYDLAQVRAAHDQGKDVWVYNGVLPRTGTFLLDADAISPRVNGWLGAVFGVVRWFYWESTYWYDLHGKTAHDPFAESESFHDEDGDWANGDGVLLYPGKQVDAFAEHSLGFDGVIASIRLKNWRRGLEDAGYLELARARNPERADAVARWLIPAAFAGADGHAATWSQRGEAFFDARRALFAIALGRPAVALRGSTSLEASGGGRPGWWAVASRAADVVGIAAAGAIVALMAARFRRKRARARR